MRRQMRCVGVQVAFSHTPVKGVCETVQRKPPTPPDARQLSGCGREVRQARCRAHALGTRRETERNEGRALIRCSLLGRSCQLITAILAHNEEQSPEWLEPEFAGELAHAPPPWLT